MLCFAVIEHGNCFPFQGLCPSQGEFLDLERLRSCAEGPLAVGIEQGKIGAGIYINNHLLKF
jgi:hypothetical protein